MIPTEDVISSNGLDAGDQLSQARGIRYFSVQLALQVSPAVPFFAP